MQYVAAMGCFVCIGIIWGCRCVTGFKNDTSEKGDLKK